MSSYITIGEDTFSVNLFIVSQVSTPKETWDTDYETEKRTSRGWRVSYRIVGDDYNISNTFKTKEHANEFHAFCLNQM